jgi:hypothetical protein
MLIIATTTTTIVVASQKSLKTLCLSSVDDIRGVSLDDSTAYSYIRQETGVRLKKKIENSFKVYFFFSFIFRLAAFQRTISFRYEIRKKR